MRLLHVADTHLGHAAYAKLDENGYNQRESDVFASFARAVDLALSLRVDAVLHAGDLFDSIRPSNRALHFALGQILRLSEAGVPLVAIAGNHSSPRMRETGSVFRLFEHIDGVRVVYAGAYERVELGDCIVHCVPHCPTQDVFAEEVRKVAAVPGRANVAMLHCGVSGVDRFAMGEFNENILPSGQLWPEMDYIALGHFHDSTIVAANAAYSGSTERTSFNEAGRAKGAVEVSLPRMSMQFHELETRPMLDLGRVECKGLANSDIVQAVEERLRASAPGGKILRIRLAGLPRSQGDGLDYRRIRAAAEGAVHFELRVEAADDSAGAQAAGGSIGDLRGEFGEYLARAAVERLDKAELLRLGRGYIEGAVEAREA
jgi:exonuclease SbcD